MNTFNFMVKFIPTKQAAGPPFGLNHHAQGTQPCSAQASC